jgi:hypothetical protein
MEMNKAMFVMGQIIVLLLLVIVVLIGTDYKFGEKRTLSPNAIEREIVVEKVKPSPVPTLAERTTLGIRNNNPGNVKKPGNDEWEGTVGYDAQGHAIFVDRAYGVRALYKNFKTRQRNHPEMELLHYLDNVYAEENGDKEAMYVADRLGISVNTKLKDIDLVKMVVAVAWFESNMVLTDDYVRQVVRRFNL